MWEDIPTEPMDTALDDTASRYAVLYVEIL